MLGTRSKWLAYVRGFSSLVLKCLGGSVYCVCCFLLPWCSHVLFRLLSIIILLYCLLMKVTIQKKNKKFLYSLIYVDPGGNNDYYYIKPHLVPRDADHFSDLVLGCDRLHALPCQSSYISSSKMNILLLLD